MKIIFGIVFLLILLNFSCKSGYSYESEFKKGKSYLSKFKTTLSPPDDSISVHGIIFLKRKQSLSTVSSAKIILIDKSNDTVINNRSHFDGFEFLILPGSYKLIIKHPKHKDTEMDSVNFERGKKYEVDVYLQKGNGKTRWVM